jgi:hypothetical protein
MGGDGAHLGVTAERAIETILGDREPPTEGEGMTSQQMREWLMTLPKLDEIETRFEKDEEGFGPFELAYARGKQLDYSEGAGVAARAILEFWEANPDFDTSIDPYETIKSQNEGLKKLGLTGFMWGWAYNAARYCRDEPPQPNPAILTIEIPDPEDNGSS